MSRDQEETYTVGYGKPPPEHQFKPGQSGNPKGRPKGVQNLSTDLKEELEEQITLTEGGQTRVVTKQRAMLKAMLAKALKGDSRAAQVLIQLKLGLDQLAGASEDDEPLDAEDQAILDGFTQRLLEHQQPKRKPKLKRAKGSTSDAG